MRATIHYTKGAAQGSEYRDVKVFANIELVGIRYADDVLGSADNPLRFFTSQKSFDETGDLVYRYKGIDSATPVIALGSQNVTVKGYSSSATGGVARDLTVTYNYNGKQFTGTFKYEVVNPTSQEIVQTGSVAIPLGASATNYLSQITFDIVSDDGSIKSANLASSTLSIVGIDGDENKTVITTDVTDVGSHYARITYRVSGDATLTGIAIYSVALVADESVYTVTDGVLTDVRGGRSGENLLRAPRGHCRHSHQRHLQQLRHRALHRLPRKGGLLRCDSPRLLDRGYREVLCRRRGNHG